MPEDTQDIEAQKRDLLRFTKQMQHELEKNSKWVLKNLDMVNRQGRIAAGSMLFFAAAIQLLLPLHLVAGSRFFLPPIEIILGLIFIIWQKLFDQHHLWLRHITISLTLVISFGNAVSTGFLIDKLIQDSQLSPFHLLMAAGVVWFTNVVTFALLYWEFDRGGPLARIVNGWQHADFYFPQMDIDYSAEATKTIVRPGWEPHYFDYLYLAVTNATAFSPTDVMPLTWKAKALMGTQSVVSLVTVTLVAARAVNIL
ncbi:MAG TPA: hypothetical protein PKB15_01825 [Acidimicrobiia bacterium]|nr:hypothetical protein [Acidimicrobiia bacterium]